MDVPVSSRNAYRMVLCMFGCNASEALSGRESVHGNAKQDRNSSVTDTHCIGLCDSVGAADQVKASRQSIFDDGNRIKANDFQIGFTVARKWLLATQKSGISEKWLSIADGAIVEIGVCHANGNICPHCTKCTRALRKTSFDSRRSPFCLSRIRALNVSLLADAVIQLERLWHAAVEASARLTLLQLLKIDTVA